MKSPYLPSLQLSDIGQERSSSVLGARTVLARVLKVGAFMAVAGVVAPACDSRDRTNLPVQVEPETPAIPQRPAPMHVDRCVIIRQCRVNPTTLRATVRIDASAVGDVKFHALLSNPTLNTGFWAWEDNGVSRASNATVDVNIDMNDPFSDAGVVATDCDLKVVGVNHNARSRGLVAMTNCIGNAGPISPCRD